MTKTLILFFTPCIFSLEILYQFNQIDKSQTQVKNALRNIASNFFYSKINIELDLDNGTFKFGSRSISNESYSTETSSLEKVESTYFKKSSKNGNFNDNFFTFCQKDVFSLNFSFIGIRCREYK